jgi:hypothetical protein
MTFSPTIQTFNGTHAAHSGSTSQNCACDFANDKLWMSDSSYLSRHQISDGTESAAATTTSIVSAGFNPGIMGWDNAGHVYAPVTISLNNGGLLQINGTSLALVQTAAYTSPHFTGGAIVSTGGADTMAASNNGSPIITSNNSTNYSQGNTYLSNIGWSGNNVGKVCPGKDGSGKSFLFISPGDNALTQQVTVKSVNTLGVGTTIGTIVPTDIDAAWSHINIAALCVDQTDGNPIGIFTGDTLPKLAKISASDASVLWVAGVPVVADSAGSQFSQSRIVNSRLAILNKSPNGVIIYNTTDGSTVDSYFTGMSGINIIGPQCYDDTIGAIILACNYNTTVGGPVPLNGSATGFTGWAALYVADAIAPPVPTGEPGTGRRWLAAITAVKSNRQLATQLVISGQPSGGSGGTGGTGGGDTGGGGGDTGGGGTTPPAPPPLTSITFSGTSIADTAPAGTLVGVLGAVVGQTPITFTVSNPKFQISGNQVLRSSTGTLTAGVAEVLNFTATDSTTPTPQTTNTATNGQGAFSVAVTPPSTFSLTLTLNNISTTTSQVAPHVTYCHPFADGDIPAGGSVTMTDSTGSPVTLQMDGVSTWPSGCVKWAVLSHACAETFAASSGKTYILGASVSAPDNTPNSGTWGANAAAWAATLAANSDFKTVHTGGDLGASVYTTSLNTIFSNYSARNPGWGTSYPTGGWEVTKKGKVCVEFHGWQFLKNDSSGKFHGHVRVDMLVKAWSPTGPFEIDVETSQGNIWDTITQSSVTSEKYGVKQGRVACNVQVKNGSTVLRYQGGASDPSSVTIPTAKFLTATSRLDYTGASLLPQQPFTLASTGTLPSGLLTNTVYHLAYMQGYVDQPFIAAHRCFVSLIEQNGTPPSWQASHPYNVGDWAFANSAYYLCTTAGTSAASGGPSGGGVDSDITDGTVHWTNISIPFTSQGSGTITASPIPMCFPSTGFSTADLLGDPIWSGTGTRPTMTVGHNFAYLCQSSKFMPALNAGVSTIAANSAIANFLPNQLAFGVQWYQSATGGGNNRIGLINNIAACAVYRPADPYYHYALIQGAHSFQNTVYRHMRDEMGGERLIGRNGTANSGVSYSGLTGLNLPGWVSDNKPGGVDGTIQTRGANKWSPWSYTNKDQSGLGGQYYADPTHMPMPSMVAYLKTGRCMFLEQAIDQAHIQQTMVYRGYQVLGGYEYYNLTNGSNQSTQLRGWAWAWRSLTRALFMCPDDHIYQPVLRDIYDDNLKYEAARITSVYPSQQVSVGIPEVLDHGGFDSKGHYAPWMLFFFIQVVALEKWGGGQTSAGATNIATISNFLANYWKIVQTSVHANAVNTISAYDLLYSSVNYSYGASVYTDPTTMWNASLANGLIDAYPRAILYDHDSPGYNFPVSGGGPESYINFAQFASTMHALAEPSNTIVENARALISAAISNRTGVPLAQGGFSNWSGTTAGVTFNQLSYAVFKGS